MSGKKLVIAAAGTGGHVMPGLAVAREMRRRGWDIEWIGTQTGMEGGLVGRDDIVFHGLDFRGMRGRGLSGLVSGAIKLVKSTHAAKKLFAQMRPDVLFTTGGYIAVPVCKGAESVKTPIVLMNCDADILMSSKIVLDKAKLVACGFAGSARSASNEKGRITGNPVRAEIEALPAPEERLSGRTGPMKLLVFGGSLGAKVLNETVPEALAMFDEDKRPTVLHQTGKGNVEAVKARYEQLGIQAEVVEFIHDMDKAYLESDVVICRSGAMTVSEICAAGAASVLVPFVVKTTQHQLGNARYMAGHDAAVLLEQSQLTKEHLFGVLMGLKRDRILQLIRERRPRFVAAFELMTVRGNTLSVSVPTTELRDEILRSRTAMLLRIAEMAGITGRIELEVTVDEQIRAKRPIRLEDRVKYLTEKNPQIAELRRALDLEVE